MLYRVELTGQAKKDLNAIYDYVEAETSIQAAEWFTGLHDALATLSRMPNRNPVIRESIAARHLLYGKKPHVYRAIYVISEAERVVTVITIRHGARRPLGRSPKRKIE